MSIKIKTEWQDNKIIELEVDPNAPMPKAKNKNKRTMAADDPRLLNKLGFQMTPHHDSKPKPKRKRRRKNKMKGPKPKFK